MSIADFDALLDRIVKLAIEEGVIKGFADNDAEAEAAPIRAEREELMKQAIDAFDLRAGFVE